MAGNGEMSGGNMDNNNGGRPQGTEYTLQGVMRFLQSEWHRHERDRNAWEIERAEMKSRIGRLEGDARTSKRMHESLGKHVKILEIALKKEREKVKKLAVGEKVDLGTDPKDLAKESLKDLQTQFPKRTGLDVEVDQDDPTHSAMHHDTERDKSRNFLGKCSQEVAYHIIPGYHPPLDLHEPPEIFRSRHHMQQQEPYAQPHHPQQGQGQSAQMHLKQSQPNHVNMVREPSIHQHMLSNYPENSGYTASESHPPGVPREILERRAYEQQRMPGPPLDGRKGAFEDLPVSEGPRRDAEGRSFDSFNKPSEEQSDRRSLPSDSIFVDEADGWNFDEPSLSEPPSATAQPHRPDQDAFPNANFVSPKSLPRAGPGSHRRKSSGSRRRSDGSIDLREGAGLEVQRLEPSNFKVRFALRGHLDVVRSVIFTGGGSPSEPEVCTCGDDGTIKRWILPATYGSFGPNSASSGNDLDITSYFTHRGHSGSVTCLAACPASRDFSNGGRALGDGWVFSGGQDGTVRVWERGRVDAKATLDAHTDAVWTLCVLPGTSGSILGDRSSLYGGADRILLASGAADGKILIWAVSSPPQLSSPQASSRRAGGSRRANSISSGSNFPSSPQPSTATATPFHYALVHHIIRPDFPSPTCISPLSLAGVNFVVSYADASVLVYDTRTGEQIVGMASLETYDGTRSTGVNSVVASTIGFDGTAGLDPNRPLAEEETVVHGATGTSGGVEGVIISGYEDRYIRLFDANSGQCTYTMLAHPAAISSLSLSPDGRELVSAGHDASLRFWSLEKRSCTQEITSHRLMRGEGVCSVVWSRDGRWVISGGGDGVVKVFART
ncbi:cell differentiation and development protein Fsr1/Pro11 [Coccidioides posadasii str. Silveira]|uniref:Cell differentiation and development protein Fsr1/Pro11 n=2 Tax=Coccidioides posadasii (strain RMSCC 757 / Silveira) TaxID=443226 RepID=E9CSY4_COCPS|nr:cell differentiation and development protein Fsr1/Pro11 [Coccidioides posadasii str. Silveira]